jgi:hypothetical protein
LLRLDNAIINLLRLDNAIINLCRLDNAIINFWRLDNAIINLWRLDNSIINFIHSFIHSNNLFTKNQHFYQSSHHNHFFNFFIELTYSKDSKIRAIYTGFPTQKKKILGHK